MNAITNRIDEGKEGALKLAICRPKPSRRSSNSNRDTGRLEIAATPSPSSKFAILIGIKKTPSAKVNQTGIRSRRHHSSRNSNRADSIRIVPKPFRINMNPMPNREETPTLHCESRIEIRFGPPVLIDSQPVTPSQTVFAVSYSKQTAGASPARHSRSHSRRSRQQLERGQRCG